MPTRSPELTRFYADIIIGATEGGTNYWAYSSHYHWSDEDPASTRVYFAEMEEVDVEKVPLPENHEEEGNPWHLVTVDTVAHAFHVIMGPNENIQLNDSLRARYSRAKRDMDAGDLDAGDADNIVQVGMFDKVVYG